MASSMALLALDVDSITVTNNTLPELADKLAHLVVEWNITKSYCAYKVQGKAKDEKNCQGNTHVHIIYSTMF